MKKIVVSLLVLVITACASGTKELDVNANKPKNIILMIGDGMGPSHIKAYRIFNDDPTTPGIDPLMLDRYLVGTMATDNSVGITHANDDEPSNLFYQVTDSAASATAYATGVRTYNAAVGIDAYNNPKHTVLELAKKNQMKTGLVATSQIVHATPAAFVAHVESRRDYSAIANAFVDNQINGEPVLDLFLGGGWKYFKRDDRDLVSELQTQGFEVITEAQQLVTSSDRLAGLFADIGLPPVQQRSDKHPSLKKMTQVALSKLDNDNGFFLMVEGSQIDWASHDNDIAGTLYEMDDFYQAVQAAIQFAQQDGDTLVLVTADHETGGLAIGREIDGKSYYRFTTEPVRNMNKSLTQYATEIVTTKQLDVFVSDLNIDLSDNEAKQWQLLQQDLNQPAVFDFLKQLMNRVTYTGWTTHGHTGVDVNLYAFGKGAELFSGHHPNTYIGKTLINWLQQP